MYILDTNFVISLLNTSDRNHKKAKEIFFDIPENEQVKIPFVVVAELAISKNSKKYINASKAISKKFLINNEDDLEQISTMPYRKKNSLKANDCLILKLCERKKAKLLSFDKNLIKILPLL